MPFTGFEDTQRDAWYKCIHIFKCFVKNSAKVDILLSNMSIFI